MIVYEVGKGLYINLTNRCTNSCEFCVRSTKDGYYGDLWLDSEPSSDDVINELKNRDLSSYSELVFCGYGEPTIKIDEIVSISKFVRSISNIHIRINTNGQANLIHGYDVTPKLEGLVDEVSVSLNTANSADYQKICHSDFGEAAYAGLIEFASLCSLHVGKVVLSVVDTTIPEADIEKCRDIAKGAGVELRGREFIN